MAQSATESRKTPLHVDAFWEKPNVTPPLSWNKWTQQKDVVSLKVNTPTFKSRKNHSRNFGRRRMIPSLKLGISRMIVSYSGHLSKSLVLCKSNRVQQSLKAFCFFKNNVLQNNFFIIFFVAIVATIEQIWEFFF